MSVQAITWALEQTVGSPTGKVILLCLANYADKNGACFPGHKTIADECEVSVRSVAEWMGRLEELGLIDRSRRFRGNGSRTSDSIVLRLPWLAPTISTEPDAQSALGEEQAEKPAPPHADNSTHHMQQVHPHTLKGNLPPNPPDGGLEFAALWKSWPTEDQGNLDNAEGAFRKLSRADQGAAVRMAAVALDAFGKRKGRVPALVMYLRKRMFDEFDGGPPLDGEGRFKITPDRPEWSEWLGWLRQRHGERGVTQTVKLGYFLPETRHPPKLEAA